MRTYTWTIDSDEIVTGTLAEYASDRVKARDADIEISNHLISAGHRVPVTVTGEGTFGGAMFYTVTAGDETVPMTLDGNA